MRLPLALAVVMMATPVWAEGVKVLDCFVSIMGQRIIDGPCSVIRTPALTYGNTYDLQMLTFDKDGNLYYFVNDRVTDFSSTISWNGTPGERKDLISLGNTYRKPNSDSSLPEKCRSNKAVEICLWDKNDRNFSMKEILIPFADKKYVFDWSYFIPPYKVDINCSQTSNNKSIISNCIKNEQTNYDSIKLNWYKFSDNQKQKCSHAANIKPWENYQQMMNCFLEIVDEEEAKNPPSFHQ